MIDFSNRSFILVATTKQQQINKFLVFCLPIYSFQKSVTHKNIQTHSHPHPHTHTNVYIIIKFFPCSEKNMIFNQKTATL